jgi:chemotaxis receptor (MCP) glutamine deamidase CheD
VTYRKEVTLHLGGVHAAAEPTVVKTLLGSCVAVCLWDPGLAAGGMNHFLLPNAGAGTPVDEPTRFGVHAMDRLIGEMLKLGVDPRRFVAKVFGGASVLAFSGASAAIPRANVRFVRAYLAREGIRVVATSVGGTLPRQIRFHTDSGRAFVRRVVGEKAQALVERAERQAQRRRARFGDVTLFPEPR